MQVLSSAITSVEEEMKLLGNFGTSSTFVDACAVDSYSLTHSGPRSTCIAEGDGCLKAKDFLEQTPGKSIFARLLFLCTAICTPFG